MNLHNGDTATKKYQKCNLTLFLAQYTMDMLCKMLCTGHVMQDILCVRNVIWRTCYVEDILSVGHSMCKTCYNVLYVENMLPGGHAV